MLYLKVSKQIRSEASKNKAIISEKIRSEASKNKAIIKRVSNISIN